MRLVRRVFRHVPGAWSLYVLLRRGLWESRALYHGVRMGPAGSRLRALFSSSEPLHQRPSAAAPLPPDTVTVPTSVPLADAPECARTAHALALEGAGPRLLDWVAGGDNGQTTFVFAPGLPAAAEERRRALVVAGRLVEQRGVAANAPALERYRLADSRAEIARVLDADSTKSLHFGREYVMRGGRYLYQSVPELARGGRRDTHRRWRLIADRLDALGLGVQDRLVLDVGCNAGMMLGAALADGAAFGVGWDRPAVAALATHVLGGLGYTRYEIVGAELGETYRLVPDLPAHVAPLLPGCGVLYLAIRHHVGFVADLADVPWRFLVYEGGEEETAAELETTLAPLRARCEFTIADRRDYRDGEGQPRPFAVLVR